MRITHEKISVSGITATDPQLKVKTFISLKTKVEDVELFTDAITALLKKDIEIIHYAIWKIIMLVGGAAAFFGALAKAAKVAANSEVGFNSETAFVPILGLLALFFIKEMAQNSKKLELTNKQIKKILEFQSYLKNEPKRG